MLVLVLVLVLVLTRRPLERRVVAHLGASREGVAGCAPGRMWTAEARNRWGRARQRASYI